METRCRGLFVIAGFIIAFASPRAQAVDPSGHWEGTVMIPGQPLVFAIDVERVNGGGWIGTFTGTDVTNRNLLAGFNWRAAASPSRAL